MSTISASTTSTTAYKVTADTTGTLVFQTGSTPTTAMTLGSDQSVTFAGTPTYSGGTANGVAYLNGSKVFTTGSSLVFDGTNLAVGTNSASSRVRIDATGGAASSTFSTTASRANLQLSSDGGLGTGTKLLAGIGSSAYAWLQVQNSNDNAVYDLAVNPLGGNLLVGTTSAISSSNTIFRTSGANNPVLSLFKNSSANTDNAFVVLNGAGGGTNSFVVLANGNALNTNNSYGAISDVRLKENIEDATPKLADLMQVKVRQYNLIADEEKQKQLGVVADELETIFPAMVTEGNDGFKNVKYSVFVPMLIKAIQELKAELDTAKAEIATLKGAA